MKRRQYRYKGYSSWLPFLSKRSTTTATSRQMLIFFLLIVGGVSLLTWLLISAKSGV